MSSWLSHNAQSRKKVRLGYHQETPAGKFVDDSRGVTVVSAYYELKSKYSPSEYRKWIRLFLENCPCHLVFYTDEAFAPFVSECREHYKDRTQIMILPREKWVSTETFDPKFWKNQHQLDPEYSIHSPELYKVWFEKKEFVKRAITLNPFQHSTFVWCDAGICRSSAMVPLLKQFPVVKRIPTDRIGLLNVAPFSVNDENFQTFPNGVKLQGDLTGKMRIGGGVLAGSAQAWKLFDIAFDTVMDKYIQAGLFCGKEQIILGTLVLENRNLVSLVEPKPLIGNPWIYYAIYLGCSDKTLQRILTSSPTQQMSLEELAQLEPVVVPEVAPVQIPPKAVTEVPKPVVAPPKPVAAPPKPVAAPPKPVAAPPKPVVAPPKPVAAPPKAVAEAPKVVVEPLKAVAEAPKAVAEAPKPLETTDKSVPPPQTTA
jgi:hypothetical protein